MRDESVKVSSPPQSSCSNCTAVSDGSSVVRVVAAILSALFFGLWVGPPHPAGATELVTRVEVAQAAATRGPDDRGFVADREVLFARCGVLPLYNLGPNGSTLRAGERRLTPAMRTNIEALLETWERYGDTDKRKLAYVLATAFRESAYTLQPIREAPSCGTDEGCRERAIGRLLQERAARAGRSPRANYALQAVNGQRYYGRGYVQLTFQSNYRRMGEHLGMPLEEGPDLVLDPAVSSVILVRGMIDGLFTSRSLENYFNGSRAQWVSARDIVNPGSPNKPITAQHGRDFDACLVPAR
jgi:hypothetical protein